MGQRPFADKKLAQVLMFFYVVQYLGTPKTASLKCPSGAVNAGAQINMRIRGVNWWLLQKSDLPQLLTNQSQQDLHILHGPAHEMYKASPKRIMTLTSTISEIFDQNCFIGGDFHNHETLFSHINVLVVGDMVLMGTSKRARK